MSQAILQAGGGLSSAERGTIRPSPIGQLQSAVRSVRPRYQPSGTEEDDLELHLSHLPHIARRVLRAGKFALKPNAVVVHTPLTQIFMTYLMDEPLDVWGGEPFELSCVLNRATKTLNIQVSTHLTWYSPLPPFHPLTTCVHTPIYYHTIAPPTSVRQLGIPSGISAGVGH